MKTALESGKLASTVATDEFEAPFLKQIHLLTSKPFMYVLNKKSGGKNLDEAKDTALSTGPAHGRRLLDFLKTSGAKWVIVDASIEQELKDLEDKDKQEMREGLGTKDDGINNLIKTGYELLEPHDDTSRQEKTRRAHGRSTQAGQLLKQALRSMATSRKNSSKPKWSIGNISSMPVHTRPLEKKALFALKGRNMS